MDRPALRRIAALATSTALLAGLAIATTAAPAAAVEICDGLPATITDNDANDADPTVGIIEGTNGPDVIVGTDGDDVIDGLGGRDHICGGLGKDGIDGGPGNDRIFGGSDDDVLDGGGGRDDIFGYLGDDIIFGGAKRDFIKGGPGADDIYGQGGPDILQGNGGPDFIRGQAGDDRIDGGPAFDDCLQNAGTGPVRRCETADLKVKVIHPAAPLPDTFDFKVRVRNNGPQASSYSLYVTEGNHGTVDCNFGDAEDEWIHYGTLRPGRSRTRTYHMECNGITEASVVDLSATVDADAHDPRRRNNQDHSGDLAFD